MAENNNIAEQEVRLSKIEKLLLGTAIVWSWANVAYSCTGNPNESYLTESMLTTAIMAIEPIGKAIYQMAKRDLFVH